MEREKDFNIAKNVKIIEWLKTEILDSVAGLFKGLQKGSEQVFVDFLANIVVLTYILGRRLGLSFRELDQEVLHKIAQNKETGHQLEEWFGDLSALQQHIDKR